MEKTVAGLLGIAAKAFTANSPTFTIVDTWDEAECPESLLD